MKVLFYTTLGCHLCDEALFLLNQLNQDLDEATRFKIEAVEISDSDALIETYGIRIPVIKKSDAPAELGWPFDSEKLAEFLFST